MKKAIKAIVVVLISCSCLNMIAQQSDRDIIASKIEFYYYHDASSQLYDGIDNDQVKNGTETGSFWGRTNNTKLQDFVRALLKSPDAGGDPSLQYLTAKQIGITDRRIQVYLWNDSSPISNSMVPSGVHKPYPDSSGYVWPHAGHWTPAQDANWGGYMDIGLHYIDFRSSGSPRSNGLAWLKETFLHELMHTQDKTMIFWNSFLVLGSRYHYGADGSHYYVEAIPDKRLAFSEAIAHVAAFNYDFAAFRRHFDWFTRNDKIQVEGNAPHNYARILNNIFGLGYNDDVWLYDQLRDRIGAGTAVGSSGYFEYNIQDLPPEFLIHNETIMGMMMTMTSMHIAEIEPFVWTIKEFNRRISSNQNQDPFALFVKIFTEGLLVDGENVAHVKQELDSRNYSIAPEDDVPYAFILPLAYSDYFTGYTSASKNDFKALFNNEMDTDLIDIYWDHFKDRIRMNVVIASGRSWTDMTDIAMQCGINQSYLPGASGRVYERE